MLITVQSKVNKDIRVKKVMSVYFILVFNYLFTPTPPPPPTILNNPSIQVPFSWNYLTLSRTNILIKLYPPA